MMEIPMLYLRCVYANKATLSGLLISAFFGTLIFYLQRVKPHTDATEIYIMLSVVAFILGMMPAYITMFGLDSYVACKRTLKHLRRYGEDPRYGAPYENAAYCNLVGHRVAVDVYRRSKQRSCK